MIKICLFIFCLFSLEKSFAEDIVIHADHLAGTQCLENGVPWQVPASIYKEAEHCRMDDVVLELGAGGSTIFLAKRCGHVTTIETNEKWAAQVKDQLDQLNLKNVTVLSIPVQKDIELFLRELDKEKITILSVDTSWGYNRSRLLDQFFANGMSDQLRMIVLDNYGERRLFPRHYNKEVIDSPEWEIHKFDDPTWCGGGTKLYIRKDK